MWLEYLKNFVREKVGNLRWLKFCRGKKGGVGCLYRFDDKKKRGYEKFKIQIVTSPGLD